VIISLCKAKDSRTICRSYRLISLLSVPGEVSAHALLGLALITLGDSSFTDFGHADDAVLCARSRKMAGSFDDASITLCLHSLWEKTKLQNISHGFYQSVSIDGYLVAVTGKFDYLGNTIDSTGYSGEFSDESASRQQ